MKRKSLITIAVALAVVLAVSGAFLLMPKVVYVVPDVPEAYAERLSSPPFFGKGYLTIKIREGQEGRFSFLRPSLVVYTPFTPAYPFIGKTLQYGDEKGSPDVHVTLDEGKMWNAALDHFSDKPIGVLYSSLDSWQSNLAKDLLKEHPNLVAVEYSGRISSANRKEISSALDSLYGVIVLDPESSTQGYRDTKCRVIMDFREAAAAVSKERVISIGLDWNSIIAQALEGEVEISADYALSVTKK